MTPKPVPIRSSNFFLPYIFGLTTTLQLIWRSGRYIHVSVSISWVSLSLWSAVFFYPHLCVGSINKHNYHDGAI